MDLEKGGRQCHFIVAIEFSTSSFATRATSRDYVIFADVNSSDSTVD